MSTMPSCEVQRTLVKSPPELWAELSNPSSLARHLGEFGEIRIARVEPETAVEWEAGDIRGAVQLKPSGWGTKVTLTAVREAAEAETAPEEARPEELAPEEFAPAEPTLTKLTAAEPTPTEPTLAEPEAAAEPRPEPEIVAQPEPESERRPGLLARIFRRGRKAQRIDEPESNATQEPSPFYDPEPAPPVAPEPAPPGAPDPEPAAEERPDLAAELAAVEEAIVEQDAALLTAVLDRLGAAHHRPFSRG